MSIDCTIDVLICSSTGEASATVNAILHCGSGSGNHGRAVSLPNWHSGGGCQKSLKVNYPACPVC